MAGEAKELPREIPGESACRGFRTGTKSRPRKARGAAQRNATQPPNLRACEPARISSFQPWDRNRNQNQNHRGDKVMQQHSRNCKFRKIMVSPFHTNSDTNQNKDKRNSPECQNRTGLPFTAGVEICVRGSLYPYTSPLLVVNRGFTLLSLSLASAVRKVHGKRHFGAGAPKRQRERSKYHMRIRLACWQRAASGNQKGEKGLAAAVRLVRFPRES
ncbi:hypothetical protein SELMODRAFT_414507 [Selaginella moellendorffii]|uniref:Uncharacterized protein n=1 Tax=Selaginella moellendorffii TaxID=88036 RepID=D8RT00_SELML|nr:hypothetical protein SELMODRAFT_414507 [Selaginella moellendorffii]